MIVVVVVVVLKVHEVNQEQSSKKSSFYLEFPNESSSPIAFYTYIYLYIKVKGKVDPKVVSICEHLRGQSCPLLRDLTNLKFIFKIAF